MLKKRMQYLIRNALILGGFFLFPWVLSLAAAAYGIKHSSASLSSLWLLVITIFLAVALNYLALYAAIRLAGNFVYALYDLESPIDGAKFVTRSVLGCASFRPYLTVKNGGQDITPTGEKHPMRRIGGPGSLVLYNDTALVLEKGGRLTRVITQPSFVTLDRFEKIHSAIDLRPRHWEMSVSALSKEGIPLTCKADVSFQIADNGQPPTDKVIYPTDPQTVLKAATSTWVREIERFEDKMDWTGRVIISNTEGTLRAILARTPLDDLVPVTLTPSEVGPEEEQSVLSAIRAHAQLDASTPFEFKSLKNQAARARTRRRIQKELRQSLEAGAPGLGVKITGVDLGEIIVKPEVTQQWQDLWRTVWRTWATEQIGKGKAERIQILEAAKIQAQVELLTKVSEAMEQMGKDKMPFSTSAVALRFIESLGQVEEPSEWTQIYLPTHSLKTLEELKAIIRGKKSENGKEENIFPRRWRPGDSGK